jgi:hypothetical protein
MFVERLGGFKLEERVKGVVPHTFTIHQGDMKLLSLRRRVKLSERAKQRLAPATERRGG